jgi:signal transduction histidine kinase/CheY-like chemotaxis protein
MAMGAMLFKRMSFKVPTGASGCACRVRRWVQGDPAMDLHNWITAGRTWLQRRLRDPLPIGLPQGLGVRQTLFWKYVVIFTLVTSSALVIDGLVDIWFTFRDHRSALFRIQKEQAVSAASKITQFIREIEAQLGWTTHLSWKTTPIEQRALDGRRLLRQLPAIAELALLDGEGRERLRMSRQAMDEIDGKEDFSTEDKFTRALADKVYYGPVYFRRGTEPFMTLSLAGARRDAGVSVAEVNLTHIWDVVNQIRVGRGGRAYVVDAQGRLIAHPEISLVLRYTDFSQLAQVKSARAQAKGRDSEDAQVVHDDKGRPVLAAYATAAPLNWLVLVELPEHEANAPLNTAILRIIIVLVAGLVLALLAALVLARLMVVPVRALAAGAARIGAGQLDHRIKITSGDELEALGDQLNDMAAKLQGSYATLERKVEERTQQLQAANLSKSRFLAAASHDLRQPLHALNLFAAQLRYEKDQAERDRLAVRIDTAVANMNELFNALLDISKLDAGAMRASVAEFPVSRVLTRIAATFTQAARDKGLSLNVVLSSAWVRSDPILLEQILLNLVSNAVRYTSNGGIVVGCRRRGEKLRIDVCDSGIGIAAGHQRSIFGEFYQVAAPERSSKVGLGLGLAIVERLCAVLDHPIELASTPGKGSCFSIVVPRVAAGTISVAAVAAAAVPADHLRGKLIVVIDDDALALEGTGGLLRSWGCRVVAAESERAVLARLEGKVPDLIISDFHLQDGRTGIDAIAALRDALGRPIPAFLISGDITQQRLRETGTSTHLLHKPVNPMALRAIMSGLLKGGGR